MHIPIDAEKFRQNYSFTEVKEMNNSQRIQTIVIGGGQPGLAVGYHLAKRRLPFLILDANQHVGDAWRNRWDSLRLFNPARYAGLPGTVLCGLTLSLFNDFGNADGYRTGCSACCESHRKTTAARGVSIFTGASRRLFAEA